MTDARRAIELHGPEALFRRVRHAATSETARRDVRVVTGTTVVDVGDLVLYPLGTGIQRVTRMVGRSWRDRYDHRAVGWTPDMDAMVPLTHDERDRALRLLPFQNPAWEAARVTVVVPWRCTYVLPELAIQPSRCLALGASARSRATGPPSSGSTACP